MGTKFRTMLAPINAPTGDGRRFATGAITMAPTPFPIEWVRERQGGHDGAVVVGVVTETSLATVADAMKAGMVSEDAVKACGLDAKTEAVWARGEFFDDADREEMPRLAEDVAEAMTLVSNGVLGPSVDLDSFEGRPVRAGTDDEINWADIEEAEAAGDPIKLELLITEGRVRAATLVSIPAFMETSQPLALDEPEDAPDEEDGDTGHASDVVSLVASVAIADRVSAALFDTPKLAGPTPITIDPDTGRIFGHAAEWRTCHLGYPDVCVTPPQENDFPWFNRFPVETGDGGIVWAGRLTVGGHHPTLSLTASATMARYDGKTVAAYVRASRDDHGIVISGVLAPDLDEPMTRVLSRRKVSGDWRETSAGLSLVELLALSPGPRHLSEPGFPVATHSVRGRQVSLTASLSPDPDVSPAPPRLSDEDIDRVLARRDARARAERERETAVSALSAQLADHRQAVADSLATLVSVLGVDGD